MEREELARQIADEVCRVYGRDMSVPYPPQETEQTIPLTKAQQRVLDAIVAYRAEHGISPTLDEIAAAVGCTAKVTIFEHVRCIEKKGWIRRAPFHSRAIEVLDGRTLRGTQRLRELVAKYREAAEAAAAV